MVALLMIVLLGFAALAIDQFLFASGATTGPAPADAARTQHQQSSGDGEDAARARAVQIVNLNRVAGDPAVIDPDADDLGGWDFLSICFNADAEFVNAVEVTVRREADSPGGSETLMLAQNPWSHGGGRLDFKQPQAPSDACALRELIIVRM